MRHYLLFYDVEEDFAEYRLPFRSEHLAHARRAHQRGELIWAEHSPTPVDGAVLLFRGSSPAVAAEFAKADPYVLNGLVTAWRVREWTTVAGDNPAMPVLHQALEVDAKGCSPHRRAKNAPPP